MIDVTAILDVIIAIMVAVVCSGWVWMVYGGKLPKWWTWIAIVPLLSIGFAISIAFFPRTGSPDFNAGRADFVALIFYGCVLPLAYMLFAIPLAMVIRWIRSRRANQ